MSEDNILTEAARLEQELAAKQLAEHKLNHSEKHIHENITEDLQRGLFTINYNWFDEHLRIERDKHDEETDEWDKFDDLNDRLCCIVNECKRFGNYYELTITDLKKFDDVWEWFSNLKCIKESELFKILQLTKEELLTYTITSSGIFVAVYNALADSHSHNIMLDAKFNERWYSLKFKCEIERSWWLPPMVSFSAKCQICEMTQDIKFNIPTKTIDDGDSYTFYDFIDYYFPTLKKADSENVGMNELNDKCQEWKDKSGTQISVLSPALYVAKSFFGSRRLAPVSFGTIESPKRAILEFELEVDEEERRYGNRNSNDTIQVLPYVRFFSCDRKKYMYVDVRDITEYVYDDNALDKLILPTDIKEFLSNVFNADMTSTFGDIIRGKHGGLIICTSGPTGVGKTLTAETFGEVKHKPIYPLDMGELGVTPESVEDALQLIFERVTRWDALLLFDEADVFLAERGENIEKCAIVSIFLRLLDYFKGTMFLTTNRLEVLDKAILSRITISLDYPKLDRETRISIWKTILESANVNLDDPESLPGLASIQANGRQIRNIARIAKIIHGDNLVSCEQLASLIKYSTAKLTEISDDSETTN